MLENEVLERVGAAEVAQLAIVLCDTIGRFGNDVEWNLSALDRS